MTLRELITSTNISNVVKACAERQTNDAFVYRKDKTQTRKEYYQRHIAGYQQMVDALQKLPKSSAKYPIRIYTYSDAEPGHTYTAVDLINPDYVAPAPNLKPYGLNKKGQKLPAGHYDGNDEKHIQYFGVGYVTKWKCLIDSEIVNQTALNNEQALAEILWELSWYGFTEQAQTQFRKKINAKLKTALKKVKTYKYKFTTTEQFKKDYQTWVEHGSSEAILNDILSQCKLNTKKV